MEQVMCDRLKFALWVIVTDGKGCKVGAYHSTDLEIMLTFGDSDDTIAEGAKRILASMNDVVFDPDDAPEHDVIMADGLGPRLFTVEGFECMPLNRGEYYEFRRAD
jgi:hypothetical protein